jgi:hypothetical protein
MVAHLVGALPHKHYLPKKIEDVREAGGSISTIA